MRAGTMPLPVDVQTLPVYVWEQAAGCRSTRWLTLHAVLPVARAANLVFWWLLLVYGGHLGRLVGRAVGRSNGRRPDRPASRTCSPTPHSPPPTSP